MFGKLFSRRKVTKTVTAGGKTETTTVEDVTGDPAAEAKATELLAEAGKLFAQADAVFASMGYVPPGAFDRVTKMATEAEKLFTEARGKEPDTAKSPEPPPDFLPDVPSREAARLGSRTVVRYKGRYYGWSSSVAAKPAGYYALDTIRPEEGQP